MARISTRGGLGRSPGWLLYGGRLAAYVPTVAEVTPGQDEANEGLQLYLQMALDIVDGRLQCIELTARRHEGGPTVTGELLRRVPVAGLVSRAARHLGVLQERKPGGMLAPYSPPPLDFAAHGMTPDALEAISRVYAWAQASGDRASGILLNDFGIPRPTSSRWLATARERGILLEDHLRIPDPQGQPETSEERREYHAQIEAEVAKAQERWRAAQEPRPAG